MTDRPSSTTTGPTDLPVGDRTPAGARSDGATAGATPRSNPLMWLVDRLTSVRLGITTLTLLFVYAAIGSAGHYPVIRDGKLAWSEQMLRQLRPFEMTEFEWFHTPVFIALVALLCVNLTLVTVRRIPFNTLKLGVWMIHSGIIIMTLGSTWYFMTKFEGDTPVVRRSIAVDVEGVGRTELPATMGATAALDDDPDDDVPAWRFAVIDVNPAYQMLSAGFEGVEDFAVTVEVTRPDGATFMRQLLEHHPDLVEDAIFDQGAAARGEAPMQRVKNVERFGGRPLFDERVSMAMTYEAQDVFWVKDSFAIALREVDRTDPAGVAGSAWDQRALHGMPRYNDYISAATDVWPSPATQRIPKIMLEVPGEATQRDANDPTEDIDVRVTGFLRHAVAEERWARPEQPGGAFFPVIDVLARLDGGHVRRAQMAALDPEGETAFDGMLRFHWAPDEESLDAVRDRMRGGLLELAVGDARETVFVSEAIESSDADPFTPLGDSGFAYRVRQVVNQLTVPGLNDGRPVGVVEVEIETPGGEVLRRWVFDDPRLTRDLPSGVDLATATSRPGLLSVDERIESAFAPTPEDIAIVASLDGPDSIGLRLIAKARRGGEPLEQRVRLGDVVPIAAGVGLSVERLLTSAERVSKPIIIPRERRNQDIDRALLLAKAKVEFSVAGEVVAERWIPYHPYSFDDVSLYGGRLGEYEPARVELPDGRLVEAIFTRERRPLPHQIALEEFELVSHIGGFTGESSSIRDWVSHLRFRASPDDDWGEQVRVRVNKPREIDGVWYFQSFWDAPLDDAPRAGAMGMGGGGGKTFTGLGVGNREGVYTALVGSCLSVLGMMYAFYVKPVIKRRRQERVYRQLSERGAASGEAAAAATADVESLDRDVAKESA